MGTKPKLCCEFNNLEKANYQKNPATHSHAGICAIFVMNHP
jgi:hypothetical protein